MLSVSCGLFHTLALVETSFGDPEKSAAVEMDSGPSIRRLFKWGVNPLVLRSMMKAGRKGNSYMSPAIVKVYSISARYYQGNR